MCPKIKTPLRRALERWRLFRQSWLVQVKKHGWHQVPSSTTIYHDDALMDKISTVICIITGIAMLILPLWLLYIIPEARSQLKIRLEIITVFISVFTVLISVMTVAKPFEVLGATAGYGAVLMVYMQMSTFGSH